MNTFAEVANWNLICGKKPPEHRTPEYYTALKNQCERIAEELKEVTDVLALLEEVGLENASEELLERVDNEVLDGGCDLDVVVSGFNFLAGHSYAPAIQTVLENNNEKYTHLYSFAQESLAEYGEGHSIVKVFTQMALDETVTLEMLQSAGYDIQVQNGVLGAYIYTVHRDSDDKICKLKGHPKVDLSPFLAGNQGE